MESEEVQKSEWNIDDAVLRAIYALKVTFLNQTRNESWDLEGAYWTLRSIDSEINPAFKEDDQKSLNGLLNELEKLRTSLTKKSQGEFYSKLIETYKTMNRFMIESGWYFRKKELYMGL